VRRRKARRCLERTRIESSDIRGTVTNKVFRVYASQPTQLPFYQIGDRISLQRIEAVQDELVDDEFDLHLTQS
jgi:hypothetical protein